MMLFSLASDFLFSLFHSDTLSFQYCNQYGTCSCVSLSKKEHTSLSMEEHTNTSLCMQDWRVRADDPSDWMDPKRAPKRLHIPNVLHPLVVCEF
jgi:hypothetical protein